MESHLLQMRGLKHQKNAVSIDPLLSHLLQMRGLKLVFLALLVLVSVSHLLQMRGLKHLFEHGYKQNQYVASFTDAWIETGLEVPPELKVESHLLQMRGLKLF